MLKKSEVGFIPPETKCIAKAAFPNGALAIYLRDAFDSIYTDEAFSGLYPNKGQPAEAPWRLALITVLQFSENLSDRQAADAVRSRIDWKYALGLELKDPGFDHSILCKFRKRLLAGNTERRLLDMLLEQCQKKKLIKKRGSARTDSTHVLAKVKALSRLGNIFEAIRIVLNKVSSLAPDWLISWVPKEWHERYACRYEAFRLPEGKDKMADLAWQMGEDSFLLLDKINLEQFRLRKKIPAIQVLRDMWSQQYRMVKGKIQLKSPKDLPSTSDMIASPYDPEARLGSKRQERWTGYKVHISETCDDDSANLITCVETTKPNRRDCMDISSIHNRLKEHDLLPSVHFVDAGYMDAGVLVESQQAYGVQLCGPALLNNQWQSKTAGAYKTSDFQVDWNRKIVTCPDGKASISWREVHDWYGNPVIRSSFSSKDCTPCPNRALCTKSKTQARMLLIRRQPEYEALVQARRLQQDASWKSQYKKRAGIEGTISQSARTFGLRQSRYIGFAKTHFQHIAIATALNVTRLYVWHQGTPRAKTRKSRFANLVS